MLFSKEIIRWYQENKRDLPWRASRDPYVIWLSEVILQQTRVDQGMPYFYRFVERFPTVRDFAEASEDEILRLWQGLGYYSRARNMHHAAKAVLTDHAGDFPENYDDLIRLKGVGEYTAAAIASFAGGQAKAVVDGNVYRVLARYFGVNTPINSGKGKKEFQLLADEILDRSAPGLFNQAIMEFGSLQCKPKNPDCARCVLRAGCQALASGQVDTLPVKLKSKPSRDRFFHYLYIRDGDQILINKRGPGDIWENLYELPLIEETADPIADSGFQSFLTKIEAHFGQNTKVALMEGPVRHVLSHQNIYAYFWSVEPGSIDFEKKQNWNYVNTKDLNTLAKPKLIVSFLERAIIN